jgi:hypothetical protein
MPLETRFLLRCTLVAAGLLLAARSGGSDAAAAALGGSAPAAEDPLSPPADPPTIELDDSLSSASPATALDAEVSAASGYAWSLVSGPGPAVFEPANAMDTTVRVMIGGTYVLRLTASGPGGSASEQIPLDVTAERYALAGAVQDSDGGTAAAIHLDWSPLGGHVLSDAPSGDGAWSFSDLVAPIEQLSLRLPGG